MIIYGKACFVDIASLRRTYLPWFGCNRPDAPPAPSDARRGFSSGAKVIGIEVAPPDSPSSEDSSDVSLHRTPAESAEIVDCDRKTLHFPPPPSICANESRTYRTYPRELSKRREEPSRAPLHLHLNERAKLRATQDALA